MTTLGANYTIDCSSGQIGSDPATSDQQAASDANGTALTQAAATDSAIRQWVVTNAQSAVGLPLTGLSLAQLKALVAYLFYLHGMVDQTGTVQPIATWH